MELSIHIIAEFHDQLTSTDHVLLTSKETMWSLQDHIMLATFHKSLVFLISSNHTEFLIKTNKICDYDEFSKLKIMEGPKAHFVFLKNPLEMLFSNTF